MPNFRTVVVLLAWASLASAAETVKLRTLTGKSVDGELVSISDKEIVIRAKEGPVTTALKEALDLDFGQSKTAPSEAKFTDVELTDGTVFHCTQFALKGSQVELKLVGGTEVKLGLAVISSVLNDAQDAKIRDEWQKMVAERGNQDLLAIRDNEGTMNRVNGTFGEGVENGARIQFESSSGTKSNIALTRVQGMSFLRKLNPEAPSATCKVIDTSRNTLAAAKVTLNDGACTIETAAGVQVALGRQLLARVDYSQGKLTYLSDLEPIKVVETSNIEAVDHYRRDKNLDNGPLRVGKEFYSKGLALHAHTELVYDIGGQYKEFKAVLGVDPQVGGDSDVKVLIEGDGQKLFADAVKRKDNPRPLSMNVKGVRQLRIVVDSNGLLNLGDHLNLADAKVSK
jgi:hypothetical protein